MTPFCVLVKGFEPPRFPRLILSQMRMPFRHTSELHYYSTDKK